MLPTPASFPLASTVSHTVSQPPLLSGLAVGMHQQGCTCVLDLNKSLLRSPISVLGLLARAKGPSKGSHGAWIPVMPRGSKVDSSINSPSG